jgi:hypothetical protein
MGICYIQEARFDLDMRLFAEPQCSQTIGASDQLPCMATDEEMHACMHTYIHRMWRIGSIAHVGLLASRMHFTAVPSSDLMCTQYGLTTVEGMGRAKQLRLKAPIPAQDP